MRGLHADERAALQDMISNPDGWLDEDDEVGTEVRDRLVVQGRAKRSILPAAPGLDPEEWETLQWDPTELGVLALRVCADE